MYDNINEMKVQADRSYIPAYTNSFFEQSLYMAEAVENDYYKLFESVGVNELKNLIEAKDISYIYEAGDIKSFKDKIIQFFKDLLAKIKGAYDSIVDKLDQSIKKMWNNTADSFKSITPADIDKLNEVKIKNKFGSGTRGYNYMKIIEIVTGGRILKQNAKIVGAFKNDKTSTEIKATQDDISNSFVKEITGTDSASIASAVDKLKSEAQFTIIVDKKFLKSNWSSLIDEVKGGNLKNEIKKMFKREKELIDKSINVIKKTEENEQIIKAQTNLLKQLSTICHSLSSAAIDLQHKHLRASYNICLKTASLVNKNSKKVNESTNYRPSEKDFQGSFIESMSYF